jgi:hypothetical protein
MASRRLTRVRAADRIPAFWVHPTFGRVPGATRSGLRWSPGVTDVYGAAQADRGKRYRGDRSLART